ncbi:MAG: hypothetical protein Q9195_007313 [Heterodermia aff. obscurata]
MSSSSRDRTADRLSPLQSVVTDSAHENAQAALGQSRGSLDNPQPDSIEFQAFSQREDNFRDAYGLFNGATEGTSNPAAPASFGVNGTPSYRRQHEEGETLRQYDPLNTAREEWDQQRRVLRRLKAWHDWDENCHKSLTNFLMSKIGYPRRPSRPTHNELHQLALFYFPRRAKLKVIVCDYGDNRFERRNLQDQVDAFNILQPIIPELNELREDFPPESQLEYSVREDILWRAKHLGRSCGHWDLARTDLPWQLTEGIHSDLNQLDIHQIPEFEDQMLSQHGQYSKAALVRDWFQCLHRTDGFLLTMSPSEGVSYLNQDLAKAFEIPPRAGIYDSNYHYLEYVRRQWSGDSWKAAGTTTWSTADAEYLLTYIMTKLQRTPTHSRQGKAIPDIQGAYIPLVSELKRRRGSQFKRHESVKLVREYVMCMNEISQILEISEQKTTYLKEVRNTWESHKLQMIANKAIIPEREGDLDRIIVATIRYINDNHENLPRLLGDLKSSLDVVSPRLSRFPRSVTKDIQTQLFQLRTIEQNELAIIAESNNRAILVFTVVTIVFLPLSFFTSYFGMNLRGIADTDKTERYFWAVCGSVTVFVVTLTVLFGFKNRLHAWVWENREFAKGPAKGRRI